MTEVCRLSLVSDPGIRSCQQVFAHCRNCLQARHFGAIVGLICELFTKRGANIGELKANNKRNFG